MSSLYNTIFNPLNKVKRSSGIIVTSSNNTILLVKDTGQGLWSVPKGGVRVSETFLEGGIRELREETGINLEKCHPSDFIETSYCKLGNRLTKIFTLTKPISSNVKFSCSSYFPTWEGFKPEICDWKFFNVADIDISMLRAPSDRFLWGFTHPLGGKVNLHLTNSIISKFK